MNENANAKARINGILLSVAHKIGLFLAMAIICLPGLWIVLASFRPTVEIMAKPDVDGALVGGAALNAEEFAKIIMFYAVS